MEWAAEEAAAEEAQPAKEARPVKEVGTDLSLNVTGVPPWILFAAQIDAEIRSLQNVQVGGGYVQLFN